MTLACSLLPTTLSRSLLLEPTPSAACFSKDIIDTHPITMSTNHLHNVVQQAVCSNDRFTNAYTSETRSEATASSGDIPYIPAKNAYQQESPPFPAEHQPKTEQRRSSLPIHQLLNPIEPEGPPPSSLVQRLEDKASLWSLVQPMSNLVYPAQQEQEEIIITPIQPASLENSLLNTPWEPPAPRAPEYMSRYQPVPTALDIPWYPPTSMSHSVYNKETALSRGPMPTQRLPPTKPQRVYCRHPPNLDSEGRCAYCWRWEMERRIDKEGRRVF